MTTSENNTGYVSTAEGINLDQLKTLIEKHIIAPHWQFLGWPHSVELLDPDQQINPDCDEGQVFNPNSELRWRRRGQTYDVLLLSIYSDQTGLTPLAEDWTVQEHNAQFYPRTETRFPKGLGYQEKGLDIGQRYFIDSTTAYVQFIALRVNHDSQ
ncbi:MAG: hypothetical protein AAFQ61_05055 [Cyanobacteria bacterium J06626_23]